MRRHPSQMPASSHISQRAVAKGLLSGNPEVCRLFILMPPFGSSKHFLLESHWQQYLRSCLRTDHTTAPYHGITVANLGREVP